uniref:Metaxin n=1 Tax=Timema monikensis TaxID=170555 RepID=A0A7R9E2M9_9NEOP|nr:unnamed protein product [Timema monikensis]
MVAPTPLSLLVFPHHESRPKTTSPSPMKLEVYKGCWGLPSFDVHCLQILAYAKFSKAPLQVYVVEDFRNATTGKLPYFSHEDRSFTDSTKIISYLMKLKFNTDLNLSLKQKTQLKAYKQLIKEELYPGFQYNWWLDDINYNEVTWESYSSNLSWPRKLYYPWNYKRDVQRLLKDKYGSHAERSLAAAMKCLNALSTHLGTQVFFLGGSPTSLDALVFAHLAPLLKAPLPSAALQKHLNKCGNLVKFVERVIKEYFPGDIKVEGLKIPREEMDPFPNRRRHQRLSEGLDICMKEVAHVINFIKVRSLINRIISQMCLEKGPSTHICCIILKSGCCLEGMLFKELYPYSGRLKYLSERNHPLTSRR